jgi:hypothetical protein
MKSYPESETLRVLPLGGCGSAEAEMMYGKQRRELARRGELMNGYLARRGGPGGTQLDPVLRSHLGLDKQTE